MKSLMKIRTWWGLGLSKLKELEVGIQEVQCFIGRGFPLFQILAIAFWVYSYAFINSLHLTTLKIPTILEFSF